MEPWGSLCQANERDIFRFPSPTAKRRQSGLSPVARIENADESISKMTSTFCKTVHKTESQLSLKNTKGGGRGLLGENTPKC